MWSKGDGGLIKLYPELMYLDHTPNSAELFLISTASTVIANIVHDMYRHLWRDINRTEPLRSSLRGLG